MKALVEYLATSLVEYPDKVQIDEKCEGLLTTYYLTVARADLGRVIGKKGRTAKAMRILLGSSAQKKNSRVALEIVEPTDQASGRAFPTSAGESKNDTDLTCESETNKSNLSN
jgi:predicted RNA-binding protein YlqC (UPF0109 family)